jgi:GNAT superfamily N-acetyltransferase
MVIEVKDVREKRALCRRVLEALPQWFGIPEAVEEYVESCGDCLVLAWEQAGEQVGFAALTACNKYTVEVCVMGVLPDVHRQGIGRNLLEAAAEAARAAGYRLMEVKTLDGTHPDEGYRKTRAFYRALGFLPLECIPELWGTENPCLIMVRPL